MSVQKNYMGPSIFTEIPNYIIIVFQFCYLLSALFADVFYNADFSVIPKIIVMIGLVPSIIMFFIELFWKLKGYASRVFKIGWHLSVLAVIFGILLYVITFIFIVGIGMLGA